METDALQQDLEHARSVALSLKAQLDSVRLDAQRIVWAMVIASGGECRVPYRLLGCEGGRLSRTDDIENDGIILKADMGIGKDLHPTFAVP